MRALITNDDGIDSVGLHTLAAVARDAGLEVVVAAPHAERSGASASLIATRTDGRMIVEQVELPGLAGVPAYGVEATPAYITWAAIRGAFGAAPDLVLSGINKGPNTGNAILHSGTVGAVLTGSAHGIPGIAVSVPAVEPKNWDTAADVASKSLAWLIGEDRGVVVLNVNVPDLPLDELAGIRRAPLATVGAVQADIAEVGEGFVTLTFSEIDVSAEPETDAGLLTFGYATITPLAAPCEAASLSLTGLA